MENNKTHWGLSLETFAGIVDHMRDELIVIDREYRIVYVNKACQRHYGKSQKEMIGTRIWFGVKSNDPAKTLAPGVFAHKRPMEQSQLTYTGARVFTSAVPFLDNSGEAVYVIMNVRDERATPNNLPVFPLDPVPPEDKGELVYCSRAMDEVVRLTNQVVQVPSPCLILGETGTGKSRLARYMHDNSRRSGHPFVSVNCAGIPQDLMESELYGHKKGAFTGAISDKKGLFDAAKGGTLFLDEISELPLSMQAKLLHTLQEKEFRPVGDTRIHKTDVKVLAATNRDVRQLVENRGFRSDLYFRLNVFEINIPPLRNRPDDIVPLYHHFHNRITREYGIEKSISQEAMQVMSSYGWPGNIRELSHIIERLMVTCPGNTIQAEDLPSFLHQQTAAPLLTENNLDSALEAVEKQAVKAACGHHQTVREIAAALGISSTRAFRLIKKYKTK